MLSKRRTGRRQQLGAPVQSSSLQDEELFELLQEQSATGRGETSAVEQGVLQGSRTPVTA